MHGVAVYQKEGFPLQILTYFLDLLYFTQSLTSFSSIDHLHLYARFLILFHLTQMKFSLSMYLLICLSQETLASIITTGQPILVELIDLVNSVKIFISQMTLLRSLIVALAVLPFWIYFFLLTLIFLLQWLSLHSQILIMWLSQVPLSSIKLKTGCLISSHTL